ncbi:MAG: hypothetical protein JW984_04390 [Deltaproteobacteria bacterium]|uniref:Uncharacterized protein n=1 Tax=Candidatus Zymogenus saltonus TaxID=2844893 RepID=A0A9D8PNS5_9DELT|nr:hypothetical protein [Candidatus Zymogenus saltonus]
MGCFLELLGVVLIVVSPFLLFVGGIGILTFILGVASVVGGHFYIKNEQKKKKQVKRQFQEFEKAAEEERLSKKQCPQCGESIPKEAKMCRFCNFRYSTIYQLTVYKPEDTKKAHFLIKKLSEMKGIPYSRINSDLQEGMTVEYPDKEKAVKNKSLFELHGCRVEIGEVLKP